MSNKPIEPFPAIELNESAFVGSFASGATLLEVERWPLARWGDADNVRCHSVCNIVVKGALGLK